MLVILYFKKDFGLFSKEKNVSFTINIRFK